MSFEGCREVVLSIVKKSWKSGVSQRGVCTRLWRA